MRFYVIVASFLLLLAISSEAQVPNLINFQASIEGLDANTASVTFKIYDEFTGGNLLWEETHSNLTILGGNTIHVLLGSEDPFDSDLFVGENRYLSISINGEETTPRSRITSVAYALQAQTANQLANDIIETLTSRIDALNTMVNELSARESIRGMFQRPSETTGCSTSNPFTGACSCDVGYTERVAGATQNGSYIFYCTRDG